MSRQASGPRRMSFVFSIFGTTQIHLRNPWVAAWWSASFPGFGHLLLNQQLKGYLLFIWEMVINMKAKINLSLLYSFTGRFDMAKTVIDARWVLLYTAIYLFAIWDSYRAATEINKIYTLSAREFVPVKVATMNVIGFNYLDKKNPVLSAIWSLCMPGMGHLYIHRILSSLFILIWWIVISYESHLLEAVNYTFVGEFSVATSILNPQWMLFMPSIVGFAAYDAYVSAVENNKLFDREQAYYLKTNYQQKLDHLPHR